MTKFLWSRRLCSCLLCCGGNCCPSLYHHHHHHHHHHQKLSNLKSKRDHLHHHRNSGHIWRKTVVFGIFVFTLYFALLSFVSFLAVSNHRMVISSPANTRTSAMAIGHAHIKNGSSSAYSGNESLGDRTADKSRSNFILEKGGGTQSQVGSKAQDGGNVGSINSIDKSGDSQINSPPRRDVGYMNDLMRSRAIFKCVPVHYREKSGSVVALASFPGSGNTWLRYLLQLATGVFTGSVYKDFALLRNGFPAESITNGRVLVVKTHESGPPARSLFEKAILLVRKPSEAILAEFNRRAAGHIGHAGRDKYTRNAGRYWSQFVAQKAKSWTETNLDWIERFSGPLLITMYHQLVQNSSQELTSILDFLHESVSDTVMNCVINNKEGIYRRRKKYASFNPFTPQMEKFLAAQEKIVYNAIQRRVAKDSAKTIHGYNNTISSNKDVIFIPNQRKQN